MNYRVRVYSHPTWEGLKHTVAVCKSVTVNELGGVISKYLDGEGLRVVVEDETYWSTVEEVIDE